MAYGEYEGKTIDNPELRKYFDREYVVNSDWYKERLARKQQQNLDFITNQLANLEAFAAAKENVELVDEMDIKNRISIAKDKIEYIKSEQYIIDITGTVGSDPLYKG